MTKEEIMKGFIETLKKKPAVRVNEDGDVEIEWASSNGVRAILYSDHLDLRMFLSWGSNMQTQMTDIDIAFDVEKNLK